MHNPVNKMGTDGESQWSVSQRLAEVIKRATGK